VRRLAQGKDIREALFGQDAIGSGFSAVLTTDTDSRDVAGPAEFRTRSDLIHS